MIRHIPPKVCRNDAEIGRTWDALELGGMVETGAAVEIRCPKTGKSGHRCVKVVSGYFTNRSDFISTAAYWSGRAESVYFTPNPVLRDLAARACNRWVAWAEHTTADRDILSRRWLLVDFDPVRPAGVSSTSKEHEAAHQRAQDVRGWLSARGFPEPIYADSGNGAHLLYRVDYPNDTQHETILRGALAALAARFDDEAVTVDPTTFNASRIVKVYGTLACKGDSVPELDRVWRLARLIDVPPVALPIEL